jgi:hypothetical protein
MLKNKTSAVLSLALVFVSGALVGVLAHRAYIVRAASTNPPVSARKPNPQDWRKHFLGDMRTKVKLDDGQMAQVNAVFDWVDVQIPQLNAKQESERKTLNNAIQEKITAILRPDQIPLYAQFRADRDKDRERRKMQGRGPGGPGGPGPGGPGGPPPPPDSK